jgi:hypothetical protein
MPYIPYVAGLVPVGVICGGIGYARWRAPRRWIEEKEKNKNRTKTT